MLKHIQTSISPPVSIPKKNVEHLFLRFADICRVFLGTRTILGLLAWRPVCHVLHESPHVCRCPYDGVCSLFLLSLARESLSRKVWHCWTRSSDIPRSVHGSNALRIRGSVYRCGQSQSQTTGTWTRPLQSVHSATGVWYSVTCYGLPSTTLY